MDSSDSARRIVRKAEVDSLSRLRDEPFDPADDAYAQAELETRLERMERMIEKAQEAS